MDDKVHEGAFPALSPTSSSLRHDWEKRKTPLWRSGLRLETCPVSSSHTHTCLFHIEILRSGEETPPPHQNDCLSRSVIKLYKTGCVSECFYYVRARPCLSLESTRARNPVGGSQRFPPSHSYSGGGPPTAGKLPPAQKKGKKK